MAHTISNASLEQIYNRLSTAPTYHPLEADTFADWSMEAGDTVTVTRDGNSYTSPVYSSALTWKKGQQVTVSSTGNKERDSISKVSQSTYNSGSSGLRATQKVYDSVLVSYNNMVAGLEAGVGWATIYAANLYTQMKAGLYLTSESAHLYVDNKYAQMTAGLMLTSDSAHLYVDNKYAQMTAGLKLTSDSAHLYVDNKYSQMTAGLKLTSDSAHLYVDSKYDQMTAGLKLTSDSAHLYVDNKYSQMTAGLKLTSDSAHLYVDSKYDQMTAGLKLTSKSASLYVESKYDQMKSGLDLTMNSAALYVNSKYDQMSAGLRLTSNSFTTYVNGRTSRAYIVGKINDDETSTVLIGADKVAVEGSTTINDAMTIYDNRVYIKKPLRVEGNALIESLSLRSGSDSATITESDFEGLIKSATVSGNTLTLTPVKGQAITFSKATPRTGTWSSRKFPLSVSAPEDEKWKIGFSGNMDTLLALAPSSSTPTSVEGLDKYVSADINLNSYDSNNWVTRYTASIAINATAAWNKGHDDGYSEGYTVYDSQVSMGSYDKIPTSAGSSAVSGRKNMGTVSCPSVSSYLTFSITVHGHTTLCYLTLTV